MQSLHERFAAYKPDPEAQRQALLAEARQIEEKARSLFEAALVPARHRPRRREPAGRWLEKLRIHLERVGSGGITALIGPRGTGKTQLAVELIREACDRQMRARYITTTGIFLAIKSTYRRDSQETEADVVHRFCTPRLLVIDEFQERGETDWENRILTHIVDRRYGDLRDTVMIANLKRAEFDRAAGDSIISRLNETGGLTECTWPSFR